MKIFISWSGERSKAVAEVFSDWLKCVIQASQPWISTRDISRGAIWFSEINDNLKDVTIGIVFLTMENKEKPWILFETGALAKGLSTNRVCTFLIDLSPEDVQDPLAQFNHTTPFMPSVWELVKTINACLTEKMLDERILKKVFDTYWPQFDNNFREALEQNPPEKDIPPRSEDDILNEILKSTRFLSNRIRNIEDNIYSSAKYKLSSYEQRNNQINKMISDISKLISMGFNDEDEILSLLEKNKTPSSDLKKVVRDMLSNNQEKAIKSED